jgi:DNA polymerase-4
MDKTELMKSYGSMGARLYHLSRGDDVRSVSSEDRSKSISAETTFNTDLRDYGELEAILWRLSEKVSRRAKGEGLAGQTVVLKLKTADFRTRTRNVTLGEPTLLAARIFDAAKPMLKREVKGPAFRLIGVGIVNLSPAVLGAEVDTLDIRAATTAKAELAMDKLRNKFGRDAVGRGIAFRGEED